MTNTDSTKETKTIEYKIDSIDIKNHYEKHFSEYGLKPSDVKTGNCEIGINILVDSKKSSIAIPIKVDVFLDHDGIRHELFGAEATYTFKIKKFKAQFKTNEQGKSNIPDSFMTTLLGATVGGMRGILAASNTIPEYKKIILPLIDTSQLFNAVKNDNH